MIGLLLNLPRFCECCHSVLKGDKSICDECFYIWYDNGLTIKAEIGRYCNHARVNSYWPFDIYKQMPESEFQSIVKGKTDAK